MLRLARLTAIFILTFSMSVDAAYARALLLDVEAYNVTSECNSEEDCSSKCNKVAEAVIKTAGAVLTRRCESACASNSAGLGDNGKGHAGVWMSQCISHGEENMKCADELANYAICIGYTAPTPAKIALCARHLSSSCSKI